MSAPDIAYRLACAPVAAIGGTYAQQVALLVAIRWAQPDGRFAVRQTAIAAATGLSESTVGRAFRALRDAGVAVALARDEFRLVADHLPDLSLRRQAGPTDGSPALADPSHRRQSRPTGGTSRSGAHEPPPRGPVQQTATPVPQTADAVPGTESVISPIDVSASSSPLDVHEGEGETRARGAACLTDVSPPLSELDEKRLAWLKAQGVLLANPATGEDLRREWLALTVGLGGELVKAILAVRHGDFPSDFRKAAEPFETQVAAARRAHAERVAAVAEADAAARRQQLLAEEEARQRGPWLEQGRALLDEIDAADPRRRRMLDGRVGGRDALAGLRREVANGRVTAEALHTLRGGYWAVLRDTPLPPEPPPEPPPMRPVDGAAAPADADEHPADVP